MRRSPAKSPPAYHERRQTYTADACQPVAAAVAAGAIQYHAMVRGQYPGCKMPPQALPGVRTLGFWDIAARQEWGLAWHRNEGIEITYLERGRLPFAVEHAESTLEPGDLTFTRPWQPHRVGDPNLHPCRLHWLILDVAVRRPHQSWKWPPWLVLTPQDRRELTTMLRQAARPVWRAGKEMLGCFQRIAAAVQADREGSNASRLAALLNELFVLLLELLREGDVPFDESLTTAQHTVALFWEELQQSRDLLAREWSVGEMAHSCGMGVTWFTRLCRQMANMTPMEHLSHHRVEAAQRLLRERPEMSVTEIGLACGFGSSQYFAKVFRETVHCSPTEYRRQEQTTGGTSDRLSPTSC